MKLLIKAEILKMSKNKLFYFGLVLSLLPIILSALFMTGSEAFNLEGEYSMIGYTSGIFSTMLLSMGMYALYFALLINSVISSEINSDVIIYETIGIKKRQKIALAKIIVLLLVTTAILLVFLLSAVLGYYLCLSKTSNAIDTIYAYEVGNFIYSIFFYYGILLVIISCSFFKFGNGLVIGAMITNLLISRLCSENWLAPYIIGAPVYSLKYAYEKNYIQFMCSQYILLAIVVFIFLYSSIRYFKKQDF